MSALDVTAVSGPINRIGVIGAGQMGRGIAQLAAGCGLDVSLVDAGRDVAAKGLSIIGQQLGKLCDKKKISAVERDQILARIQPTDIYGGELESVDFVVEAATENFETKKDIFQALDRACRAGVILATNTSSCSRPRSRKGRKKATSPSRRTTASSCSLPTPTC